MPFPLFLLIAFSSGVAVLTGCYLLRDHVAIAISLALAGAFAIVVFHGPIYFDRFPGDDAFITFRYADHLANGLGPNWNSSGHVEGYTSFLWMALLAAVSKLGIGVIDAARILTYVTTFATMLTVIAIWRFWTHLDRSAVLASPLIPATTLVGLALVDSVSFWGFSGLETPMYMLLLTVSALLFMRERRLGGPPWSAVAFAFVAMTRPEGLIAAAITGLFLLDGVQHAETRRTALRSAAAWAGTFWVLYGAFFIWRFTYYGHLFPNTYYAKTEMALAVYERGADYLASVALSYHLVPAFAGVALLFFTTSLRREAAYVATLSAVLLLAIMPGGGDAFGHGRLVMPILPLLYLAAIGGFATALARLPMHTIQRVAVTTATLAVLALLLLRGSDNPFLPEDRADQAERKILGLWLKDHTPDDYTIAAWAVGSIAYYSERDFLDLFGLTDEVIAHSDVDDFGKGFPGHERYNADYVFQDVRPEIIITDDALPQALVGDAFWQYYGRSGGLPGKRVILTDPRLRAMYDVRAVEIDGLWFSFLQRKDTLSGLVERD